MKRLVLVPILAALLLTSMQPALADTAEQIAQAQATAATIDQVRARLGSNIADALAAQDQLTKSLSDNAEQQRQLQAKVDAANSRLLELDAQVARLDSEIAITERRSEVERSQIASLARAIYVQPGSVLVMLAQARSIKELFTRVADLASAGSRARSLKVELAKDQVRLDVDHAKASAAKDEATKLRDGLKTDLGKLLDLQMKQEDSKKQLGDKIDQTKLELVKVNSQSAAVAKQIADLLQQQQDQIIATAMQQVWDQVKVWEDQNGPALVTTTSRDHSKQFRFIWPEPKGQNVQGFGPSNLGFEPPFNGFPHFHTGIDLVEPDLSPIQAADDGVVALVGAGPYGYGNYVVVAHQGGLTTLYGHLSKTLVKVGDRVMQGQLVGLEGTTGNSTGPHLHFELRIAEKPVDPAPYLPPGAPSDFKA